MKYEKFQGKQSRGSLRKLCTKLKSQFQPRQSTRAKIYENFKTLKLYLFSHTFHLKTKLAKPQFGFKTSKTKDKDRRV